MVLRLLRFARRRAIEFSAFHFREDHVALKTDASHDNVTIAADLGPGGATSTEAASRLLAVAVSGDAIVSTELVATPVCVVTCGSDIQLQWMIEDAVDSGTFSEIVGCNECDLLPGRQRAEAQLEGPRVAGRAVAALRSRESDPRRHLHPGRRRSAWNATRTNTQAQRLAHGSIADSAM